MGIPYDAARNLTLWDYGMLVDGWERGHDSDGGIEPAPLTDEGIEEAEDAMRRLEARGVKVLH